MRAQIARDGHDRQDVTGRTVDSIARTHFGKNAVVRPVHDDLVDPPTTTWTVIEWWPEDAGGNTYSVLGRIITTNRGRGRPSTHPVPRTEKVLLRLTPAEKRQLASMAQSSGRSVNDEIIHLLYLGDTERPPS